MNKKDIELNDIKVKDNRNILRFHNHKAGDDVKDESNNSSNNLMDSKEVMNDNNNNNNDSNDNLLDKYLGKTLKKKKYSNRLKIVNKQKAAKNIQYTVCTHLSCVFFAILISCGCSKQCSDYCNIMLRESDFHCNYQCNVSACDYDNARCLV